MLMKSILSYGVAATAYLIASLPCQAKDLGEWLAEPPKHVLQSQKPLLPLSHCIGIALSSWGTPIALNGDGLVDVYVPGGGMVLLAIRVIDRGSIRVLEIRSNKAFDDRAKNKIDTCL